jgi:hypothetical protein
MSPRKIESPILYSAVTLLAFNINERFYGGVHYMWCTPCFDVDTKSPVYTVPPTSSPYQIYRTLAQEVATGDNHSEKIEANRVGITRGAQKKFADGTIDATCMKRIQDTARVATLMMFRPLLCVISSHEAGPYCSEVDLTSMANPLSQEYIVSGLPRKAFDVINLGVL